MARTTVLNSICRGVVGYVSYLASCKMSPVYSEYLLYGPILRVALSQGCSVKCEYPVGTSVSGKGDKKRIDFELTTRDGHHMGIEVKWVKGKKVNLDNDISKLLEYGQKTEVHGYVILFGTRANVEHVEIKHQVQPRSKGKLVKWEAGKTSYAARWYRFK